MDHQPPAPERVASAMVQADGIATQYRRRGSGPTVVVLGVEAMEPILARSYRVIAPETPSPLRLPGITVEQRARWLSGVFDGLGIEVAVIVSAAELAGAADRFAGRVSGRVRGIVVADGRPEDLPAAVARCFG
jgi:hypothetical protein